MRAPFCSREEMEEEEEDQGPEDLFTTPVVTVDDNHQL